MRQSAVVPPDRRGDVAVAHTAARCELAARRSTGIVPHVTGHWWLLRAGVGRGRCCTSLLYSQSIGGWRTSQATSGRRDLVLCWSSRCDPLCRLHH